MNGLYKTAFILMLVAAVLFIVATIVAYALERPYFSLSQMKLLPKMMISTKFRKILLTMRNKFDRIVADKGE